MFPSLSAIAPAKSPVQLFAGAQARKWVSQMDVMNHVLAALDEALKSAGFRQLESDGVLACWIRRTGSTNRAVVAIECPLDEDPALFAQAQRGMCRKAAGFFVPFLYPIGLQIVVIGPRVQTDPVSVVDTYNNQICCLQSLHIVDLHMRHVTSARTWGQRVTGPLQTAIASSLRAAVGDASEDSAARPLIRSKEMPLRVGMLASFGLAAVVICGLILVTLRFIGQ